MMKRLLFAGIMSLMVLIPSGCAKNGNGKDHDTSAESGIPEDWMCPCCVESIVVVDEPACEVSQVSSQHK